MRCADRMRTAAGRFARRAARLAAGAVLVGAAASCADGFAPLSTASTPLDLQVTAVRMDAVRLTWSPVTQVDIANYVVLRRQDLAGPFSAVAQVPQSNLETVTWIDTDVEPETHYGYRVIAVTSVGDRSAPSVVGGARTPPRPGIEIATRSLVTAAAALDPDGYEVVIAGPDTVRASIGVETTRRFSPLRPGRYTVTLSGLITRCSVSGTATTTVDVTDSTAVTITPVRFEVTCRDPNRGDIAVAVQATGAELDPEFRIDVLGQASDVSLPPAERNYSAQRLLGLSSPTTTFTNVRPGTYAVAIEDLASNCTVQGTTSRTVTVSPLGVASVTFAVTCVGSGPPPSSAPFVWRNVWTPAASPNGGSVSLVSTLDLTARTGQAVKGVQADLYYDPTVLQYIEEVVGQLPVLTVNAATPGRISFIASTTGAARTGVVRLAEFRFTVIGSQGQTTVSATQNLKAGSPAAFQDSVRAVEDTFTVGAGGGANQPPVAEANGPYVSVAGQSLLLSSAGSSDADGSIASYAWNFGDNTSGTGASVTKTYANPGTYTVTLTVTDDDGATDTDQATVTVSAGTPANTPPTAEANGPYAATVGVPLTLSSAGSADPNGVIASYSWSLGDGRTVAGASPSVTYATAGTYTLTLTVTDNAGASDTDQATVVVSAPVNTRPLAWRNEMGPLDVVNNFVAITVSYDLRTNIAETPGAEALQSFVVDSLKWDASVLQFHSISLGPNIVGASSQAGVNAGRLGFSGTISGAQQQGLITIATIRFRPVGSSGAATTTSTFLGALLGPASTNFFTYNGKTSVVEGTFQVP